MTENRQRWILHEGQSFYLIFTLVVAISIISVAIGQASYGCKECTVQVLDKYASIWFGAEIGYRCKDLNTEYSSYRGLSILLLQGLKQRYQHKLILLQILTVW